MIASREGFTVAAWNTECRLTRCAEPGKRGSPERIVEEIGRLAADIIVLPEATDGDNVEPDIEIALRKDYQVFSATYDGSGDRKWSIVDDPTMRILTKLDVQSWEVIRPGDIRNMLSIVVTDPSTSQPVRVIGTHLDDRTEAYRLQQVASLRDMYLDNPDMPIIMMGDFNAMYRHSLPARILGSRVMSILAHPAIPFIGDQTKDMIDRVVGMTDGRTMDELIAAGMIEADPSMRPTITPKMRGRDYLPPVRVGQIDRFMSKGGVSLSNHKVHHDGGSDHLPISALARVTV